MATFVASVLHPAAPKLLLCLLAVAVLLGPVEPAISCGAVASYMAPCVSYVTIGGPVPASCCGGVRALSAAAGTVADRRQACSCLKSAASAIAGFQPALAAGLPTRCGVSVPYQISPSVDCSK
ncbi:unnamed protein product [Spirodela intermedia]|uniref:Non-specific lipid-transfer protein n=1 Tax=Spirodela intermedia TaxID=51605 RepID=A0A7I8KSU6_SPIIN|nr:unnamed protein product [Spirodela intermedia]